MAGQLARQSSGQALGKEEFLQLLVAQLKHQDPLSPLKSQEFASQLAEFRSLELLGSVDSNIQQNMDSDIMLTQTINNTLATQFIGRELTALGNTVHLPEENAAQIHFKLSDAAENVKITIKDENGAVVRTLELHQLSAGEQAVEWDGNNGDGDRLREGNYQFQIQATDADGEQIAATEIIKGLVSSVRYAQGNAILVVNDREIPFGDVMQISSGS